MLECKRTGGRLFARDKYCRKTLTSNCGVRSRMVNDNISKWSVNESVNGTVILSSSFFESSVLCMNRALRTYYSCTHVFSTVRISEKWKRPMLYLILYRLILNNMCQSTLFTIVSVQWYVYVIYVGKGGGRGGTGGVLPRRTL